MTARSSEPQRRLSLRGRLVLLLAALLVLGISVPTGAMFGAVQDWAGDTRHAVLRDTGQALAADLPAGDPTLPPASPFAPAEGQVPSFFQLRDDHGAVLETVSNGGAPALADPLPADAIPAGSGTETFTRAPARGGGDDDAGWLVRTARLPDGGMLVVAMPDTATEQLVGRVGRIALACSIASLVVVVALSWPMVGRAMRPLRRVADTADGIAAGDLSRRAPTAGQNTEVGRLATAFNAMLNQVQEAIEARDASERRLRRFVSDAAHELRTPVATVRGYAELFRRGAADRPEDLAKAMDRIESESRRMGALVEEMLLLARLDEEPAELRRDPVDIRALAADAVADAGAADPRRRFDLRAGGPVWVSGEDERLRRLLGNLLVNVTRHTPEGTRADVRLRAEETSAIIEVADNGPGLGETEPERVFERFFRSGGHRAHADSGAGLGLAIVAALAAAHGGTAQAENAPGGGARFRVTLPAAEPPAP
ncbi:two-component system OmpR family sensor kinase [Lipingzhangella halophila]|uniref:histidine kinase n=1 Tax=Lipingzhangella halophila TaxID=1783352 RepID=A0A7W7RCW8_9ACTN|nr:HAMP domain-containing sensor histidine kinase [Lipingzhangella halophila]MBB4929659.1 two-component system OmpR family sensor kinase [Lipingzhangella halophila]